MHVVSRLRTWNKGLHSAFTTQSFGSFYILTLLDSKFKASVYFVRVALKQLGSDSSTRQQVWMSYSWCGTIILGISMKENITSFFLFFFIFKHLMFRQLLQAIMPFIQSLPHNLYMQKHIYKIFYQFKNKMIKMPMENTFDADDLSFIYTCRKNKNYILLRFSTQILHQLEQKKFCWILLPSTCKMQHSYVNI